MYIRYEEEKSYVDPRASQSLGSERRYVFPSIDDPSTIDLSIIIPAKDEELRLPVMMEETLQYLNDRRDVQPNFTWEIVIVDDGSTDNTTDLALQYSKQFTTEKVRVLTLRHNRGKGGAVQLGMLSARGRKLLFADADGATLFSDLDKLEGCFNKEQVLMKSSARSGLDENEIPEKFRDRDYVNPEEDLALSIGSRAHLEEDSVAHRSFFRTVLMYGFHMLVWLFCVRRGIKDTQCGFKLFTRPAARRLFANMHVMRWAFDVELLYVAEVLNIPVYEIPVTWHEVAGSKIVPVITWVQMGLDLVMIWVRYTFGIWNVHMMKEN